MPGKSSAAPAIRPWAGARYLSYPGAQDGPQRHLLDPTRQDLSGADGRCTPAGKWTTSPGKLGHFRNFPGQGEWPVLQFMEALEVTGYYGPLSLEIFNDQFRAGSARSVAVDGHRSRHLPARPAGREEQGFRPCLISTVAAAFEGFGHRVHRIRGRLGAGLRSSNTCSRHSGLAAPPAQVKNRHGLRRGGDQPCRQHRERRLPTPSTLRMARGLCLGTKVDKVANSRAKLLDQPLRQPVAPGELDITAVRGVAAARCTIWIRSTNWWAGWDIEFEAAAETPAPPVGLTTVGLLCNRCSTKRCYVLWLAIAHRHEENSGAGRGRSRRAVKSEVIEFNNSSLPSSETLPRAHIRSCCAS